MNYYFNSRFWRTNKLKSEISLFGFGYKTKLVNSKLGSTKVYVQILIEAEFNIPASVSYASLILKVQSPWGFSPLKAANAWKGTTVCSDVAAHTRSVLSHHSWVKVLFITTTPIKQFNCCSLWTYYFHLNIR
jgi:hypothetical protein